MTSRSSLIEKKFPDLTKSNHHEMTYENTEFLTDVISAIGFSTASWQINPGLSWSFPQMSGIALNYETYKFNYLEFVYKPLEADMLGGVNCAMGSVGMTFFDDPSISSSQLSPTAQVNPLFSNKLAFMNYEGSCSNRPSEFMAYNCIINKKPLARYFVRQGETNGIDLKMSDLGIFVLMVQGMQVSSYPIGELYVRYSVTFEKSKIQYPLANSNCYAHYKLNGVTSTASWWGTSQTPSVGTNFPLYFTTSGATAGSRNSYAGFPGGIRNSRNFMFIYILKGTTGAWNFGLVTAGTALNILNGGSTSPLIVAGSGQQNQMTLIFTFTIINSVAMYDGSQNFIAMGDTGATMLASPTSADLFVIQIPSQTT